MQESSLLRLVNHSLRDAVESAHTPAMGRLLPHLTDLNKIVEGYGGSLEDVIGIASTISIQDQTYSRAHKDLHGTIVLSVVE